jgi:predicted DNA-binding protein
MNSIKEQTTLRLPAELVEQLELIARQEDMPLSYIIRKVLKGIVKRYKFDKRLQLIKKAF